MTSVPTRITTSATPRASRSPRSRSPGTPSQPVAGELVEEGDERVRADRRDPADRDEGPIPPDQPPVGIGEDERRERDEGEVPEHEPDRPDPGVVRLGQRRDEPEVARRGQPGAGRVLGPPPEGDEAGGDERQTRP